MSAKRYSGICKKCGKHYVGLGKSFCSKECYLSDVSTNSNRICKTCGKRFFGEGKHFCSVKCYDVYIKSVGNKSYEERIDVNKLEFLSWLENIDFSKRLEFPYEDFMATGDWHLPILRRDFFEKFLETRRHFGITTLVITGDFVDFDAFSKFGQRYNGMFNIDDELLAAKELITALFSEFKKIYWIAGNHENRFMRFTGNNLSFQTLVKSVYEVSENFQVSEFKMMRLGDWALVHPKNYSIIKNRIPTMFEVKYRTHTVTFHEHMNSVTKNINGDNYTISVGMMADPKKIAYIHDNETKNPNMENGFLVVRNNFPYLFYDTMDWDFWLGRGAA